MKLSIIIPVYNMEQYIEKCIKSCLNQDLPKDSYEIIIVNDGSEDNSVSIINNYVSKLSNIRIVHRKNGGLSAARNTGLNEAKGEYVWFIDSDDWIEENCLFEIIELLTNKQLDCLCVNLQLAFEDGHIEPFLIKHEVSMKIYNGLDFICHVTMPPAVVCGIYRKQFLKENNLSFYEGILHEDQEFTPRAYSLTNRIAYLDKPLYNYYQRQGSIMKSNRNIKRCKDLLTICDSLYAFLNNNISPSLPAYNIIRNQIDFLFSQSLFYYTKEAFSLTEYKKKPYYPLYSKGLKYKLINTSLSFYLFLTKIKRCIHQ